MIRPSARYEVACCPSTDTVRSMMRLIADLVITMSLRAAYSPSRWPFRTIRTVSIMRSSTSIRPASNASSAGNISSSVVAVRNPSPPRFTPSSGTPRSPTARAMERRVPSPPRTTSRSACAGSSALVTEGTLAAGTSPAVSFSSTAESPRARSHSRSPWTGAPPPGRRASPQRQRASRKRLDTPVDHGLEVARRAPVARAVEEELAVTLRTPERRGGDAEHVPAAQHRVSGEAGDRLAVERRVPDDSALAHGLAPHLELRLHQRDDLAARREHAEHRGQDLLQRNKCDVDDRERRLLAEDPRVERPRIGLFHDHHAGVLAQLGVELAHADVHSVHAGGAALEQAVGETTGRGAHVEADAASDFQLEGVERVGELLAAPAHER